MSKSLFAGIDLGTSGARAVIIDEASDVAATAKAAIADFGMNHRDPAIWWQAASTALKAALEQIRPSLVRAISVDGTSGTIVPVDNTGSPLADGLMYNDPCRDLTILNTIAEHAPQTSAARGASSGLARAMSFQSDNPAKVLHQADWIAFRLSGEFHSDANNALKTGYDVAEADWPAWIDAAGFDRDLLPDVQEAGSPVGTVTSEAASEFGLSEQTMVVAGTTDGCASFLATGASDPGDGVTVLGTTLTLKILSDDAMFAPQYGIYSHRILDKWLVGGASNSGGAALLKHFSEDDIAALSLEVDPETDTGLDYYPLPDVGERFPVSDAAYPGIIKPRPDSDLEFLKALLEGIAGVEALGYRRLSDLGAPTLNSIRTVGGGSKNEAWTRIRERRLGVPMIAPQSTEAAYGSAILARAGYQS